MIRCHFSGSEAVTDLERKLEAWSSESFVRLVSISLVEKFLVPFTIRGRSTCTFCGLPNAIWTSGNIVYFDELVEIGDMTHTNCSDPS